MLVDQQPALTRAVNKQIAFESLSAGQYQRIDVFARLCLDLPLTGRVPGPGER